jgi:hypothetical protein
MYFKQFPEIFYTFKINGKTELRILKDIALNVRVRKEILDTITLFENYDIIDGETPEIISEKVYGTPLYHWTIMIVNLKFDYLEDFPKDDQTLTDYVYKKYRTSESDEISTVLYQQHSQFGELHYVDEDGNVVDATAPFASAVTNYGFEFIINEKKRRIKLISPEVIGKVVSQLDGIFKNYNGN